MPTFVNFSQQQVTVTQTTTEWVCGVCGSQSVKIGGVAGGTAPTTTYQATCLNCGTSELSPAPPAVAQSQSQAQLMGLRTLTPAINNTSDQATP